MDQSHASTSPDHSNPAQAQRSIGTNGSSQQAAGMLRTTPIRQRFPIRSKQDGRIEQSPEILREKPPPARSARWREAKGCHAADPMHQKSRTNPPRHRNREIQTGHLDGDRGGEGGKENLLAEAGGAGLLAFEGRGGLLRHGEEPHGCAADDPPLAAARGDERGDAEEAVVVEGSGVRGQGGRRSGGVVTMATRARRYYSGGGQGEHKRMDHSVVLLGSSLFSSLFQNSEK